MNYPLQGHGYDDPYYDGNDNRVWDDDYDPNKQPRPYKREDYYDPNNDPFYDGNDNRYW